MKASETMIENVARSIQGTVKLVHFFKEYDDENKDKQELVEQQLENFLNGINDYEQHPENYKNININDICNFGYRLMIDSLRAAKRGFNRKYREKLKHVILLTERYKQVRPKYQTIRGLKNLMLLFKTLYTKLIDQHIIVTTLIEDDLVLRTKESASETASLYDQTLRDMVDSEESVGSAKGLVEKLKKSKENQEKDLIDEYFLGAT